MTGKSRRRIARLALAGELIIEGLGEMAIDAGRLASSRLREAYAAGKEREQGRRTRTPGTGGAARFYGGGGLAPLRARAARDARSDAFNPNNGAHRAAASNRSNQLNPNSAAYRSSRGGGPRR